MAPKAGLSLIMDWMAGDGDHGGNVTDNGCDICAAVNDIRAMIEAKE